MTNFTIQTSYLSSSVFKCIFNIYKLLIWGYNLAILLWLNHLLERWKIISSRSPEYKKLVFEWICLQNISPMNSEALLFMSLIFFPLLCNKLGQRISPQIQNNIYKWFFVVYLNTIIGHCSDFIYQRELLVHPKGYFVRVFMYAFIHPCWLCLKKILA